MQVNIGHHLYISFNIKNKIIKIKVKKIILCCKIRNKIKIKLK